MKKIIICLIVMALVIPCTAPLSALAEDNTIYRTWENLTWSLNYDTGELVIGGSGAFPNITRYVAYYPLSSLIPWYYAKENVKSLVIGDEITKVTSYMFTDFDNLTTVYLGSGLEEIAVSAFDFSDNIENFYVAEDNQHFTAVNGILYNKDMTSILRYPTARQGGFSITETVTTIGGSAFEQCFHLTDIVIPETVT
ncbi:MAG: leucine-rich repeat protein, partial [Clostridia bacterium]|nr:leucine-rich repeat protein [Clostridia bacterium]